MSVPKLRFSQFTGEWKEYTLGELTDIRSASRVHRGEWCPSGIPFYRSSDVMAALNGTKNEKAYISQELYDKLSRTSGKLEKGDILITGGGSVGVPYIVPDDNPLYTKDADLLWIKKNEHLIPEFLYAYFFTNTYRNYLMSISHVGTIAHYTIEQVKVTPVKIPELSEQQKIANVFKILDKIIEETQSEINAWEKQKRGVMHLLFSRKVRFKADDGSEFPEWEEKCLKEITEAVHRKAEKDSSEPVMMISQGNGFIYQSDKYSRENAGESLKNYTLLRRGEMAYNHGASKAKPYGVTYVLTEEDVARVPYVYHCFSLKDNENGIFWHYTLNTSYIERQLKKMVSSGVRMDGLLNITYNSYMGIKIMHPTLQEQQKIATCLSTFDDVINKTKKELEAYRELKKGLLQQMFV